MRIASITPQTKSRCTAHTCTRTYQLILISMSDPSTVLKVWYAGYNSPTKLLITHHRHHHHHHHNKQTIVKRNALKGSNVGTKNSWLIMSNSYQKMAKPRNVNAKYKTTIKKPTPRYTLGIPLCRSSSWNGASCVIDWLLRSISIIPIHSKLTNQSNRIQSNPIQSNPIQINPSQTNSISTRYSSIIIQTLRIFARKISIFSNGSWDLLRCDMMFK